VRTPASAIAPRNGAHQRGVRYPASLAGGNFGALPAASGRGMWLRKAPDLYASRAAGHAGGALLLRRGAHDLQLVARLPSESAVIDVGRSRAGGSRRRERTDPRAGGGAASPGHPDAGSGALASSAARSGAGGSACDRDAGAARVRRRRRADPHRGAVDARATGARAASRGGGDTAPIVAAAARARPPYPTASIAPTPVPTRSGRRPTRVPSVVVGCARQRGGPHPRRHR
jgi:hypothetical protein